MKNEIKELTLSFVFEDITVYCHDEGVTIYKDKYHSDKSVKLTKSQLKKIFEILKPILDNE